MGPALQTALALADPLSLSVRAVQVTKAMPVWHSERIAFLGDAVHVMSPAGGLGANTALADAASLATHLAQAGSAAQALRTMVQICKRGARRRYAFHAWRPNGCNKTVTPATQRHDRHSIISTTSSQAFYRTPGPIKPAARHIQRQHRHRLLPQPQAVARRPITHRLANAAARRMQRNAHLLVAHGADRQRQRRTGQFRQRTGARQRRFQRFDAVRRQQLAPASGALRSAAAD